MSQQPVTPVSANGGTTTFSITFDPTQLEQRQATVSIDNSDGDENPFTFSIEGYGADPEVRLFGGALFQQIVDGDATPSASDHTDFGLTDVANGLSSRTFTVSNRGTSRLLNGSENLSLPNGVTISGAAAQDFTVITQPATSLGIFGSSKFKISFNPSAPGPRPATITIDNNDPDRNPFSFAIQGPGSTMTPEIVVTGFGNDIETGSGNAAVSAANGTQFGTVSNNGTVVERTYVIKNTGTANLNLGANAVSVSLPQVFSVASQPAAIVAPNATTSFTIRFTAQQGGFGAGVRINNDDSDEGPFTFTILANGNNSLPEINVTGGGRTILDGDTTPDTADHTYFGGHDVTSGDVTRVFTVENTGTADLTITSAAISGAHQADFTITQALPGTITAGNSAPIHVKFNPTAQGVRTATLSITNDDGDESPYSFDIQGTGENVVGDITIVLNVEGSDTRLDFSSATTSLNFSLNSIGGTAQTNIPGFFGGDLFGHRRL